jgi:hypothetical protein
VNLPIGIWALLFGVGFVVLAGLALVARAQRPRSEPPDRPVDRAVLRAEAKEFAAHAAAAREAAGRAAAAAVEAREHAAATAGARDLAWQVQEEAHRAYEAAWREALAGRAVQPDPVGSSDGTMVSRAALSAYRRGDISVDELRVVWRRAGGGEPDQDRREELAQRAAADERAARRAYDRAAAVARRAERIAYVAEVAAAALADEAVDASAEAHDALLASRAPRSRVHRRRDRAAS